MIKIKITATSGADLREQLEAFFVASAPVNPVALADVNPVQVTNFQKTLEGIIPKVAEVLNSEVVLVEAPAEEEIPAEVEAQAPAKNKRRSSAEVKAEKEALAKADPKIESEGDYETRITSEKMQAEIAKVESTTVDGEDETEDPTNADLLAENEQDNTPAPDNGAGTTPAEGSSENNEEPITLQYVRDAIVEVSRAGKKKEAIALLGKFGVTRAGDLPEDKFEAFLLKLSEIK